jgi:hypothetical protein
MNSETLFIFLFDGDRHVKSAWRQILTHLRILYEVEPLIYKSTITNITTSLHFDVVTDKYDVKYKAIPISGRGGP